MKTVLFDMDGTLTEARETMSQLMCSVLRKLQLSGYNVGIVSGSDLNYIMEQCHLINEIPGLDYKMLDLYPCNGTKHYKLGDHGRPVKQYEHSFRNFVGDEMFCKLVYSLTTQFSLLEIEPYCFKLPMTGNFINYRGSMINFCPIGRNANQDERNLWIILDKQYKIRHKIINNLKDTFKKSNIEFKLGGETSIDIFPKGWDKTFVLRNFTDKDSLWFVGDRCGELGNDKELYDAVRDRDSGESFQTTGPIKTINIIKESILNTI